MDGMVELEILPSAQAEIENIARTHLALVGPQSAGKITDAIFDAMEQLRSFPLSGPLVPDEQMKAAGYRYAATNKYLIFYRFFDETVIIYHVVHGAADYPKLFRGSFF